ncbi:MAG: DUF4386 domain-containing protein [Virgibacillus proomii]|jgi:hypothetical protein
MLSTTVLMTIAINTISIAAGLAIYYISSKLGVNERKKVIEQLTSYIINFVLFIWLAKIIWQFPLFISDPVAVLAYPSNAQAFYLALFLILIQISYHRKKRGLNIQELLFHFIPVFLSASFTYQFIDIVWLNNQFAWGNFLLMMFLLLLFLRLRERLQQRTLIITITLCWVIGKLILSNLLPYTTIFGYMIHPLLYIVVGMICMVLFVIRRKRVSL